MIEFTATLSDYEANAQRLSSPADIYWSMALRATEATLHGDLSSAEQLARGAALRGYELEQFSEGALILQRFVIRYQQSRLAEELPVLQRAAEGGSVFRAGASLMATAYSESGQHDRACDMAWATLGPDGSKLPKDVFWLGAISLFSGVAAHGDDGSLQDLLTELIEPCADQIVVFGVGGAVLGCGHHWLGLLAEASGDADRAIEHFRQALDIAEAIDAPFWLAQAQMDLSRLLATGEHASIAESARLVRASTTTAARFGFERVLPQTGSNS